MRYKIIFGCPDDKRLIAKLIDSASKAGAGRVGNYSRVATVLRGYGTWKTEARAHPHIGKAGSISSVKSVKIEMLCPAERLDAVRKALLSAHPYEEPLIEVVKLEDVW